MTISLAASIIDHLDIQHHKNVTVKQIYDLVPSEKLVIPRLHALTTLFLLEREREREREHNCMEKESSVYTM